MFRRIRIILPLACFALGLVGCGGGGALSGGGDTFSGKLSFQLGGGPPPGTDVTTANVVVSKLELRSAETGEFSTLWTGSSEIDLLSSEPAEFEGQLNFGTDITRDFDLLRVHISHVTISDTELGTWDKDVAWTISFPLDMRLHANRTAALRAILPLAAFEVQDDDIALNEQTVHQANGTVDGGVLQPRWVDAVYLDLTHLSFEIEMPDGQAATGVWFSNDNTGFFVDNEAGTGGSFYSWYDGEFCLGGTYVYDDASKDTLTWRVEDPMGVLTGKAYALRSVCPMKASSWNAIVMGGGKSESPIFILAKTDSSRNIVDLYGGDISLNVENDPTKGGTAEVLSLHDILYGGEGVTRFDAALTYDGKIAGTYSFQGEHGTLPSSGNWVLFLPGG